MHDYASLLLEHPVELRSRGRDYMKQGRVHVLYQSKEHVEALVRGTRSYSVELRLGRRGWTTSCTCPAHRDRGQCKHVCAVSWTLSSQDEATLQRVLDDEKELDEEELIEDPKPVGNVNEFASRLRLDKSMPVKTRLRLLEQILADFRRNDDKRENLVEPAASRSRRFLHALESNPPIVGSPRRSVGLEYHIRPTRSGPDTTTIEVRSTRHFADGTTRTSRALLVGIDKNLLDETDRMAVAVLVDGPQLSGRSYSYPGRQNEFTLQPELQRLLLPKLAEAERLFLATSDASSPIPLVPDDRGPWLFRLDVESGPGSFELEGALERADERIPLAELDLMLAGGFAIARGRWLVVDWHGARAWASHLREAKHLTIPREQASDLVRILARMPLSMPVQAQGLIEDLTGPPRPVLILFASESGGKQIPARIDFEYAGERFRRAGPGVIVKGERVLRARRAAESESEACAQFSAAGGKLYASARESIDGSIELNRMGSVVRALIGQAWLVEGEGLKLRTSGSFALSVSTGIDWFDVEARIEFDGVSLELPALLEAVANRQPLVRLSDGSFGLVPEEWLAQWGALSALGEVREGSLRVKHTRGFLLDCLLAERTGLQTDAAFDAMRTRLARAREPEPTREPAGFRGELREYQRAGLGWLAFMSEAGLGACLADDMGLGKTIQLLALVLRRKKKSRGPTLVVAPKTLIFNWESEAERFTPELSVLVHHGLGRARKSSALEDVDLVVTTYGTLRQDAQMLGAMRFDMVVLDEAQAIKNASSQSAKAARILQADQRIALTGTPIENRLEDMLSIFEFLNPGLLEGSRLLRKLLDGSGDVEVARLAARALGPFILRRTKTQVLTDLPDKTEQIVSCELEGPQRREYNALRDHYRRTLLAKVDEVGIEKAGMNVLEALLRLRQAACHLALVDASHARTRSAKLDTLFEMLAELRDSGHKALIFSQFTSFLALVRVELDARKIKYEYLDGKTRKRDACVDRFQQDPATSLFLISLKAGGVGLNLTAADYVFLLDPWWNPAVERQAIDRTHRIGQTRAVTAYRLVARDTVEEKVLALQDRKRALADALFEGTGSGLRELTREDLEAILA